MSFLWSRLILVLLTAVFGCVGVFADYNRQAVVPRFVSLKKSEVNMHVGPGFTYPIEWKLISQWMPMEVLAEFDTWRLLRDYQGTQGWVHKSMLCGKRMAIVLGGIQNLHKSPDDTSKVIAKIEEGVIAKAIECQGDWCRIEFSLPSKKIKGWIKRQFVWGVYPYEVKFG